MQYNAPLDQPSNPNAPYIDGNPAAGIQGSIVPAASIEYDQRETVEVITRANVRNYSDFSGTPCAVPANTDLTQLRKAIEGFITSWQFLITTEVTFTVHGSGANFPDLIAAFNYLGKYKITPTGHVILQLGGALPGAASAQQYIYTQTIIIDHPNNDRISIFGAKMLAPVPRNDTGYAWNGPSTAQRAADTATNLAMLRTKFATELHFVGPISSTFYPVAGIQIIGICLMHLDALLLTGDSTSYQGSGFLFNCAGYLNNLPKSMVAGSPFSYDGLAAVNWRDGYGFNFDVGSMVSMQGETGSDQNTTPPLIACGNNGGIALTNGGFITSSANAICLGNDTAGFYLWPRSGTQWDGGLFCNANAGQGIQCYLSSTGYLSAPLNAGATNIGPSHCYRNGGYGLWCEMTNISASIDFGAGANGNNAGSGGGQIYAGNNSGVQLWGSYANYTPCTPAFGTNGNNNSMINVGW
jgi:hypothetical protein